MAAVVTCPRCKEVVPQQRHPETDSCGLCIYWNPGGLATPEGIYDVCDKTGKKLSGQRLAGVCEHYILIPQSCSKGHGFIVRNKTKPLTQGQCWCAVCMQNYCFIE